MAGRFTANGILSEHRTDSLVHRMEIAECFTKLGSIKMKKLWAMSIAAMVLLLPLSVQAQTALGSGITGIKKIVLTNDAGQNLIEFISTAPLEDIHGTATGISGTIQLNADHLEKTTGHISVEVRSMETGVKKRDRHLHSDEWLDAEKYPTIEFQLRKLEQKSFFRAMPSGIFLSTVLPKR